MKNFWYSYDNVLDRRKNNKILKFYNKFPEPYKSQAIENFLTSKIEFDYVEIIGTQDSLLYGFSWENSTEGKDYWRRFYFSLI